MYVYIHMHGRARISGRFPSAESDVSPLPREHLALFSRHGNTVISKVGGKLLSHF